MKYSFHLKGNTAIKAQDYGINASSKDMCSVRCKQAGNAMTPVAYISELAKKFLDGKEH